MVKFCRIVCGFFEKSYAPLTHIHTVLVPRQIGDLIFTRALYPKSNTFMQVEKYEGKLYKIRDANEMWNLDATTTTTTKTTLATQQKTDNIHNNLCI